MSSIFAIYTEDNISSYLRVSINYPESTQYEEGIFFFSITIPSNYHSSAPYVKFERKIYHPNIDESGYVSCRILENDWKPIYNLKILIDSINYLFEHPNIHCHFNQIILY